MESRYVTAAFLCLMFLGFSQTQIITEPAECENWRKVFPNCTCEAVLDENGNQLAAVASVDCSSKGLSSVPRKEFVFPRILYEFRLRDNQITTLPDNAFQGVKIRHLDMTGNRIGDISTNAFQGTENEMLILSIEGNSVALPQRNALTNLNNLKELTMKNYNIKDLSEDITDVYFNSFRNLQKLTLDNWHIQTIGEHAFLNADNRHPLRILNLINQEFSDFPVDVLHAQELENLESLRISNSKIKTVSGSVFSGLKSIKEIILNDNQITSIEADGFKDVGDTLEKLDFTNNFLGAGQHDDLPQLKELRNLRELSLRNNEFSAVPKMENLGNGQAFHLDFSQNGLSKLSATDLINYIARLRGLDLNQNKIDEIDDNTFSGASALESFGLAFQDRSEVPLNIPNSLANTADSLTHLDLSVNKLEQARLWETVEQLNNLRTLILHNTDLSGIPNFAFQNLVQLNKLDLSYNNGITQLTDKTFVGPRMIQTLALRSTGITAIPACFLHNHMVNVSLDLGFLVIKCDCTVKTLLERIQSGSVTFPDENSVPSCDSDGSPLSQKDPADLNTCDPEDCINYYTTLRPTQPQSSQSTTSPPSTSIQVRVPNVDMNSITISWTLTNSNDFQRYRLRVSSFDSNRLIRDEDFTSISTTQQNIPNLTADTNYQICVYAYFRIEQPVSNCVVQKTDSDPNQGAHTDDSSSADTGIIVGCIVGVLALLAILAAVVYLLVIRRRPQKASVPTQPRTFAKSELPTMNGDSRSFVKNKKNGVPDLKPIGSMQVVAISDGQTRPSGGRVGRAQLLSSDGTYEPMNKVKPKDLDYEPMKKPFDSQHGTVNAAYENDHGSLPPTPKKDQFEPMKGSVNAAYENDQGSLPPTPRNKQFDPQHGMVDAAYKNEHGSLPPTPRHKQPDHQHQQGMVNEAYENDRGSLPPTPKKKQFDPQQGRVNAGFENDHGYEPSSPVNRNNLDKRSPRHPHHGYRNDAFSHDKYDEITV